jgi:PIN domain nuclease of toxin-antitoxin system
LYAGRADLFPLRAKALIDDNELLVSPMVSLELQYLYEMRRAKEPASSVLEELRRALQVRPCELPFQQVVEAAWSEDWTRDPFDRLIVSQARLGKASLLTKDRTIRDRFEGAVWD